MKPFYNILGILYQVIFAKDSFIKFKLKNQNIKNTYSYTSTACMIHHTIQFMFNFRTPTV